MNWKIFYQPLRVSTYTFLMKCWEYISLAIMIIILGLILIYFIKEVIKNFRRKDLRLKYDTQKEVKRKIEREQAKLDKFLKKQLKKVKKVKKI